MGLVACGSGGGPGDPDDPGDPDNPGDPNPEPAGPRGYNAYAYSLAAAFDWNQRVLAGHETITLDVAPGHPRIELDTYVDVEAIKTQQGTALTFQQDPATGRLLVDVGGAGTSGGRVVFTVDYHVATSGALLASSGRDDDPVTSRMVFTDSEPDRSRQWMVVNDHPSDRALWSVEVTVPAGEDVVANGVRTSDTTASGARVVRYQLDKRIPTYMMAFAAGEIVHTDRTTGRVPLSVWHRRGLLVNAEAHLDILTDLMAHFEPLVGPYPWPS
ncbi:MAG: hypothetical protein ACREBE_05105, partial [bacterium]